MGQIVGGAAKPKRCNLNKLSQFGTPAAGEHILVSSDNSMNAAGQGNFDCYIVGDGTTAATALELKNIETLIGVFDISSYHATGGVLAKYADLTAALGTNGANIPDKFRKGGMSVMFVQSSDNKYVQFRYVGTSTANADFTNVENWQGVDIEPIDGSHNLMESGGTYGIYKDLNRKLTGAEIGLLTEGYSGYVDASGNLQSNDSFKYFKITKKPDDFYIDVTARAANTLSAVAFFSSDVISSTNLIKKISGINFNVAHFKSVIPNNCVLITVSTRADHIPEYEIYGESVIKGVERKVENFRNDSYKPGKNLFDKDSVDNIYGLGYHGDNNWWDGSYNTSRLIEVEASRSYVFSKNGIVQNARWVTFFDANGDYISNSVQQNVSTILIPSGCKYVKLAIVNSASVWNNFQMELGTSPTSYEPYIPQYNGSRMQDNSIALRSLGFTNSKNLFDPDSKNCLIGYYVTTSGAIANANYNSSDFIEVEEGDIYGLYVKGDPSIKARFLTYYNSSKVAQSYVSNVNNITIPSGIKYVRFSLSNSVWSNIYFGKGSYNINYKEFENKIPLKNIENNVFNGITAKGTFSGTVFSLASHVSKNLVLSLLIDDIEISSGSTDGVRFGVGRNTYGGLYVDVTTDSVKVYTRTGSESLVETLTHGLTIDGRLYIFLDIKDDATTHLIIRCNGNQYEHDLNVTGRGQVFFTRTGSGISISDYSLSVLPRDIDRDIWIFGDSYYGYTSDNRHPYYLLQSGYKNFLLNQMPGIDSASSLPDVKNLLMLNTKPKYLLWGLGMNGGNDSDIDTPNATWLECVQKVINICKNNDIIPILATIPTALAENVNPNVLYYHEGKNKWIRESGYRYIDYAKAVGATAEGLWITGCKGTDIHPTAMGAKMLASQVLIDFPEIAIK